MFMIRDNGEGCSVSEHVQNGLEEMVQNDRTSSGERHPPTLVRIIRIVRSRAALLSSESDAAENVKNGGRSVTRKSAHGLDGAEAESLRGSSEARDTL